MFDLREYKELIRDLVSKEDENGLAWKWSVKSVGKTKARIFWAYLEYMGEKEPYFTIKVEDNGDGCWIGSFTEQGMPISCEIVEDNDIPWIGEDPVVAITKMVNSITGMAHKCY